MNASKLEWRAQMRQASVSWLNKPATERAVAHAALEKNLHDILQGAEGIWGAYSALPDEPALDVYDHEGPVGSVSSVRWAFPKISEERAPKNVAGDMRYFIPKTKDSFLEGAWGMREPDAEISQEVTPDELAGVLIPALAFDRAGIRLGRGKGYYDKWLSGFQGTKVGVAYSWQITAGELPREAFDIPMDIVVTEVETFRRERSGDRR